MNKEEYKATLEKQGYRFLGDHSAIKTCTWTKNAITNNGVCYKQQFYGIKSHLCAQISVTTNICDQNCTFCWRKHINIPFNTIDNPQDILDQIPEAQKKLLSGPGGHKKVDRELWKQGHTPKHLAISLTGETLYYPKLNELIKLAHKENYTTFVVTNGSQPEILKNMEPPTQLYLSLDAPNETIFKSLCKPLNKNAWQNLNKSLEILNKIKTRTAIRITCVKGLNMVEPENYAKLLTKANPLFVEVKAYMLMGDSVNRLRLENMPLHPEVKAFAEKIIKHCDYKIIDEHTQSRVCLLMKKDIPNRIMKF